MVACIAATGAEIASYTYLHMSCLLVRYIMFRVPKTCGWMCIFPWRQELEDTRREAEEHLSGRSEATRELDVLRQACRCDKSFPRDEERVLQLLVCLFVFFTSRRGVPMITSFFDHSPTLITVLSWWLTAPQYISLLFFAYFLLHFSSYPTIFYFYIFLFLLFPFFFSLLFLFWSHSSPYYYLSVSSRPYPHGRRAH